jgi:hypothetical protein
MSFSVDLFVNNSPVEKIGKDLTGRHTISGIVLKRDTSILRPVLLVNSAQDIFTFNYMYIAEFSRYYFIDDIRSVHDNMWEVSAHVDVLETYKNQILSNQAVIRRQTNKYNTYLNDPEWKVYANENVVAYHFSGSPFNKNMKYVLAVAGA